VSAAAGRQGSSERAVLAVLATATMTYGLMQSLVIPALPAVQRELGASTEATSWTVTAFLLTSAVATPVAGRLGDMFGKRRTLVAVLTIVVAGTLLCLVPSIHAMIAGRAVQGVSGGVLPLAYSIARDELSPARVPAGIALLASMLGIGGALGVVGAGVLVEHLSYTWIFLLQLPAFAGVAALLQTIVPESRVTSPAPIDWTGAALMSSGLVALLLTVTQANAWGLTSTATATGLAVATVLLGLWVVTATRRTNPLLDIRLLQRRPVWTTNVVAFMVGVGQFVGFIFIPHFVQEPASTGFGFAASPLDSGIFLVPMSVGLLVPGVAGGAMERRFGARALLVAGSAITALGYLPLTFWRSTPLEIYTASGLLGLGSGITMAALATIIVAHVAQHETGVATGINNVARTLGGAVGGQLAAALLVAGSAASGAHEELGYTLVFGLGLVAMVLAVVLGPLLPGPLEEPTEALDDAREAAPELA
jgi:MFS family permease